MQIIIGDKTYTGKLPVFTTRVRVLQRTQKAIEALDESDGFDGLAGSLTAVCMLLGACWADEAASIPSAPDFRNDAEGSEKFGEDVWNALGELGHTVPEIRLGAELCRDALMETISPQGVAEEAAVPFEESEAS